MMVRSTSIPASGMGGNGGAGETTPFGRLVEIVRENDEILAELPRLERRVERARGYAEDAVANPTLAASLLNFAMSRRAAALDRFRSNRAEALAILRADRNPPRVRRA